MASASALDDTEEKCNGTKLARLLIDGGTETLRRTFDSIHAPASLQAILHTNKPLLNTLRTKKRVLNSSQWDKLYPPRGAAPDSKTFDITLLFILLRNICSLTAPATGWDALPPAADVSREANLARIKYYRNQVYGHVTGTGVSKADFQQYWNDISCALTALGSDQVDIDLLKSSAIGETEYMALLAKWKSEEDEVKEMFCDLKEKVQTLDAKVDEALKKTPLLEQLSKCEFAHHTNSLVDEFQEGTRKMILDKIEAFSTNPEQQTRALVITALPGVGKSVLAAIACRNAEEKGRLGACHFIQHNDSQRNNPRVLIESVARHFCDRIEGFKDKLHCRLSSLQPDVRKKLDEMDLKTLTTAVLEDPLSALPNLSTEQTFVIVLDALDEIEPSTREEFISVFLSKLCSFPKWIKFVLTSRPTKQLLIEQPHVTVVNIEAADSNNTEDIRLYLSEELQSLYHDEPIEKLATISAKLTERSQGIFLYAHFAIESAKKRNLSLSEISELFPKGISSVYEEYLTRSQTELKVDEEKFINFLEGIIAARAPLPLPLVLQILGINKVSRQEKKVARKAQNSLSLLFPEERKCLSIFHKSLADWLTIAEDEDDGHDFCVKVADGHRVLAEHCLKVLRTAKNHKSFPPELSDSENYALSFGFHHMLEAGGYEEQLGECVQDLELLAALWVARGKTTSRVPGQRIFDMMEELERISDCCSLPDEDLLHLCKVIRAVIVETDCPQLVLQCAAYCPSSNGLSSKATQLLSSPKYRNCIWMERQEKYSFGEDLHVLSCRPSKHTATCLCRRGPEELTYCLQADYTIITLNIEDGRQLAEVYLGTSQYTLSIQVSPSDKYVVVYEKFGRRLQLRNVGTLQMQRTFEVEDDNRVLSCCFVPGNKLAAGCQDKTVRVWDVESGAVETTLRCPTGMPVYCTASPVGELLTVELGSSKLSSAVLWRSLTHPVPEQRTSHMIVSTRYDLDVAVALYLDPDTAFMFGGDRALFTQDGKLVASVYNGIHCKSCFIRLYDVTTAQLLECYPIEMLLPSIIFIDDSHILLNGQWFCRQSMKVLSINDGSTQDVAAKHLFVWYKGTRECVAIDHYNPRTLYKLTFHNLK